MDRVTSVASSLCSSAFTLILLVIFGVIMALPASMVGMGVTYIDDCPRERFIPLYLIVGGSTALGLQVLVILMLTCSLCDKSLLEYTAGVVLAVFCGIVALFSFAWFIAGTVWIHRIEGNFTENDPTQSTYCYPQLYWYSYWLNVVYWILLAGNGGLFPGARAARD